MTRTFTREFLREELGLPYESDIVVRDKITNNTRWEIWHELIFEYEGKLYRTEYSKGATEFQETTPWENETNVTCVLVEPYEKIVVDYRAVK